MRMRLLLALALAIGVASCTESTPEPRIAASPGSSPSSGVGVANEASPSPFGRPMGSGGLKAPPPVTIRYLDRAVALEAWTYCYKTGCADGAPPKQPLDIGEPEAVVIEYPLEDWRFNAYFTPAGQRCGRTQNILVESTGDGRFILYPAGNADTYDVTLMGRGGGDLFVSFRWTTPADGPLPKPNARLAVLAGDDDEVLSYGVELQLRNLASTPREASAEIKVTSAEGNSHSFRATGAGGGCTAEGTVYWDGPDEDGRASTELGTAPFTYNVVVTLDGRRYRARAVWPDDVIKGNSPSVNLQFRPPLPSLGRGK